MFEKTRLLWNRYYEVFSASWQYRHENTVSKRNRDETDFLPAMLEIQESPSHPMAKITMWLILILFTIAMVWMVVGKIDITASAPGKILPDSRIKIIQVAQAGVVKNILVRDGDIVEVGDVLVELDNTLTNADEISVKNELLRMRLESEMRRLLVEEKEFAQVPELRDQAEGLSDIDTSKILAQQQSLNNLFFEQKSRIEQIKGSIIGLEADLMIEKQGELDSLEQIEQGKIAVTQKLRGEQYQIEKMQQLLPIAKSEYESFVELHEESIVSRIQMQQAEEKYISIDKDLQYKENEVKEIRVAAQSQEMELQQRSQQYKNRAQSLKVKIETAKKSLIVEKNRFRREMNDQRTEAIRRLLELEQSLVKAKQSQHYQTITAPASGVVQQLAIHTQGAVVQAAQAIMTIIPKERVLEIEAFIDNKDIGFVREGQLVEIKVDAFPYTKYGLVHGVVAYLSADAIEDEKRGLVYQAKIKLKNSSLIVNGKEQNLAPGMSVVAEVKTGNRRVIEFFMAPLIQHGKESLNER